MRRQMIRLVGLTVIFWVARVLDVSLQENLVETDLTDCVMQT